MKVLVTGGAGFIGSHLVRYLLDSGHEVHVLDKLTYAGRHDSIPGMLGCEDLDRESRCAFTQMDVVDVTGDWLKRVEPQVVLHLAAESHVDRSVDGPDEFVRTNVVGTHALLKAARAYWESIGRVRSRFVYVQVSTDEVFGALGAIGTFNEQSRYQPNSPYSASKAAADHLVRAYGHTYDLPVITTHCSNNYGPRQFPEKLIPHVILKALGGDRIPVYGDGQNVRDWIHVDDHVRGIVAAAFVGRTNGVYCFGGGAEKTTLQVVEGICEVLDEVRPKAVSYREQIEFVRDRPGHDFRYAIDWSWAEKDLSWRPRRNWDEGLRETVLWYLENEAWWRSILDGSYRMERVG